ncbi:hypothetical protein [Ralstonia soli]|uniref:Uncharacterized protein n=1 Tax=Ralstonia soli TaxID=2953896 RepID=A0ABT1AMV4_9RALS|nr:hypothetical protein [Ralstonia soli]MCO5399757.1 hypothetical protein [Ralstonia soli]
MNIPRRSPRHERDFNWFLNMTLWNLVSCHASLRPGAQPTDFMREILNVVEMRDDSSVEEPLEIVMQFVSDAEKIKGQAWAAKSPICSVLVSCTYCLRAMDVMEAGDPNLAWSNMADARYWCGVAMSSQGLDEARELVIGEASAEALVMKAKSGAEARKRAYAPVQERAYQLAWERRPASGWQSRAQAVDKIKEEVHAFSLEHGPALKKNDSLRRTLDGWLAQMPDASVLFPSRKTKA